jgi:hypothetical protein
MTVREFWEAASALGLNPHDELQRLGIHSFYPSKPVDGVDLRAALEKLQAA